MTPERLAALMPREGDPDRLQVMLNLRDYLTREIVEERRRLALWDETTMLEAACEFYGVTVDQVLSGDRTDRVVKARHLACWVMRQQRLSTPYIGRFLGVDHTTVIYAERRVERDHAMRAIGRVLLSQIRDSHREVS